MQTVHIDRRGVEIASIEYPSGGDRKVQGLLNPMCSTGLLPRPPLKYWRITPYPKMGLAVPETARSIASMPDDTLAGACCGTVTE